MSKNRNNAEPGSEFAPHEVEMLIRAAAAAPSLYNSQPWRLVAGERELQLVVDPTRRSPRADPENRQQIIACGAALLNARLAVRSLGNEPQVLLWPYLNNADHVATVRRGHAIEITPTDHTLYAQIHRRHTNREWFGARPISQPVRQALRYLAASEGVRLQPIESVSDRAAVTELLITAIRRQRADLKRAAEMSHWLRTGESPDGMPIAAWQNVTFPVPGLDDHGRTGDWERRLGKLIDAHEFFVLTTPQDDQESWLAAGQGLQRTLLKASHLDLGVSFFNQAIEDAELREVLDVRLGARAQMLLRIGYPTRDPAGTSGRCEQVSGEAPAEPEEEYLGGRWVRSHDRETGQF